MSGAWDRATEFAESWVGGDWNWRVGDVVRMKADDETNAAYGDATIIGFAGVANQNPERKTHWYARLARPYCYANTTGACPGHLVGVEVFEVPCERMVEKFRGRTQAPMRTGHGS